MNSICKDSEKGSCRLSRMNIKEKQHELISTHLLQPGICPCVTEKTNAALSLWARSKHTSLCQHLVWSLSHGSVLVQINSAGYNTITNTQSCSWVKPVCESHSDSLPLCGCEVQHSRQCPGLFLCKPVFHIWEYASGVFMRLWTTLTNKADATLKILKKLDKSILKTDYTFVLAFSLSHWTPTQELVENKKLHCKHELWCV